jgi:hypothetical protein
MSTPITGLSTSIARAEQAFTGISPAAPPTVSNLLAQVRGLALDAVSLSDPEALNSYQGDVQRLLLRLSDLAPIPDPAEALEIARKASPPPLSLSPLALSTAALLRR